MLPGIGMALLPLHSFPCKVSVYSYIITCVCSAIHHGIAAVHETQTLWLRIDLVAQQITAFATALCWDSGYDTIWLLSVASFALDLENTRAKTLAHGINAACTYIACGPLSRVHALWTLSIVAFAYDPLVKHNLYSHSVFHILLHCTVWAIWQELSDLKTPTYNNFIRVE
jgi:hypothetical protein